MGLALSHDRLFPKRVTPNEHRLTENPVRRSLVLKLAFLKPTVLELTVLKCTFLDALQSPIVSKNST